MVEKYSNAFYAIILFNNTLRDSSSIEITDEIKCNHNGFAGRFLTFIWVPIKANALNVGIKVHLMWKLPIIQRYFAALN